jgi:tRNA U34 2-thiouridine synthase MnmA/TrmU
VSSWRSVAQQIAASVYKLSKIYRREQMICIVPSVYFKSFLNQCLNRLDGNLIQARRLLRTAWLGRDRGHFFFITLPPGEKLKNNKQ